MPHQTKIATCSYCGRRQTLRLTARDGHELACGSCGAPLHEMKALRVDRDSDRAKPSPRRPAPHGHALPRDERPGRNRAREDRRDDPRRRKRRKKRKGLLREVFEEAFDILEDIFD